MLTVQYSESSMLISWLCATQSLTLMFFCPVPGADPGILKGGSIERNFLQKVGGGGGGGGGGGSHILGVICIGINKFFSRGGGGADPLDTPLDLPLSSTL